MNLIFTILIAGPLGYFVKTRSTAVLTYLLVGSYLFTYQSTIVTLDWFGHESPSAFGPFPDDFPAKASSSETLGYGLVNLAITAVGVGLVLLANYLAARRHNKNLTDTATSDGRASRSRA